MFCFTSFGARIDHSINTGRAPYTFKINGQNYHRIGSLLPKQGIQPRYAQLYFFDTENEVQNRISAFTDKETLEGVDPSIVQRLIEMLNQSSSVAKAFRMAKNWCHSHGSINVQLKLLGERTKGRQYNKPTVTEVAALITNDFGNGVPTRDVIVDSKDRYNVVTRRPPIPAILAILGGRVHSLTRGDRNAEGLGKRIVLAGTFTGRPRYMMSNYQDAMALCQTYGNPDLFITFTSNLKWPEIAEMLSYLPGQKPHDRPEVGTRVFKLKLTQLLEDLTKNKILGDCRGVIYVIEFQKRGLPHVHILLWLEEHCKCSTPAQIDDIISAEIPSKAEDPEGYKDLDHLPTLLHREGIDVTMFTDWFELNKRDPAARTLTYAKIPKCYVWHEKLKLWKPRKQQKCIGRIIYSSPASGERYYLRMLLNVVRGPKEFAKLMTVNKRLYTTFKETCFAYGLLNDDKEWTHAISEASLWALGPQLHDLTAGTKVYAAGLQLLEDLLLSEG
ncbi:helicase-like protein [Tanacetum coccineum]